MVCSGKYSFRVKVLTIKMKEWNRKLDLIHAERIHLHQTYFNEKNNSKGNKTALKGNVSYIKISSSPAPLNCSYLSTSRPPSQLPSVVCVCLWRRALIPSCCVGGFFFFTSWNQISFFDTNQTEVPESIRVKHRLCLQTYPRVCSCAVQGFGIEKR